MGDVRMIEEYKVQVDAIAFTWDGTGANAQEIVRYLQGEGVPITQANHERSTFDGSALRLVISAGDTSLRLVLREGRDATLLLHPETRAPLGMLEYKLGPETMVLSEAQKGLPIVLRGIGS